MKQGRLESFYNNLMHKELQETMQRCVGKSRNMHCGDEPYAQSNPNVSRAHPMGCSWDLDGMPLGP